MKKLIVNVMAVSVMAVGQFMTAFGQTPPYTPPVKLEINSEEAFAQWTTFNSNGDDYAFYYSSSEGGAVVDENMKLAANDWLISPAVKVKAGGTYTLTVCAKLISDYPRYDKSKIELMVGDAPTVEAQTKQIFKNESMNATLFSTTNNSGTFTATADGEVYFGIHVYSPSYNGGTGIQYLDITEVLPLPGVPSGLTVTAGEKGAMEAILEWTQPTEDQFYGTLTELTGAYVYRGTSTYFTPSESNLVGTVEAPVPGATVKWTDTTVPSSGRYYYRLAAYNANGTGVASSGVQSPFIGPATSVPAVTNLVATAVEGNDKAVSLTWTQPEPSEGYADMSTVAYRISRSADGGTAVTLEEAWQGEQPYVDATIPGLGSYVYTINTVFNGSTSFTSTKSNAVVTGGTASMPYFQDFTSTNSADLYTFFHGPDGSRDWSRNTSGMLYYWGGTTADAWAVTPAFHLEKGKAYEFSFTTKVERSTSPKNLAVKVGTSATAEGLTKEVFNETITTTLFTQKKMIVSVEEDGNYYVGLYCYGVSDSYDLYVDDIRFEETIATPLPVTELTATPGEEGKLTVTVEWTNPDKTTVGEVLETVDKVEVKRGDEVVATLTEVAGGSKSAVTDAVEVAGVYEYTVVPYLGTDAGEAVKVTTAWVGNDTPVAPASVTVTANEAGNAVTVTFDAVTAGVNGGYVNPEAVRYIVRRGNETLVDDLAETTYNDEIGDVSLGFYTYSVAATANGLTGEFTSAEAVRLGNAIELPYEPDFSNPDVRLLFTSSLNYYGNPTWQYNSSKEAMYCGNSAGGSLVTPPLSMKKGKISVSWKATCYSTRYEEDFEILLCRDARGGDAEEAPQRAASVMGYEVVETIATPHVSTVSWPSLEEAEVEVPEDGRYYIAYQADKVNMYVYLYQSDVKQTLIETGVNDVETDGVAAIAYDPTTGTVTVPGDGQLTVTNVAGQTVVSTSTNGGCATIGQLTGGVYVAVWTGVGGESVVLKLMVK